MVRARDAGSLRRGEPYDYVLIVCEGEKTEPTSLRCHFVPCS